MLEKTYHPQNIEAKHYTRWETSKAFAFQTDRAAPSYTLMMPPPNVTGSLHMGHALNHTLQDILVRYMRMRGFNVLWQPGTDHAGIATQMVVERQMAAEGLTRHDLGREKFIDRVWDWKAQSGGTIVSQLRRLGVSPDWSRERFTMDDGLSLAVRRVFVDLYQRGLIYKDKRLVNWDPKLHTAVSDLEVNNVETQGHMWYIRYPIHGEKDQFITIATTRPETLLGDIAVAVHPEDERYQHLLGKSASVPLAGRLIPIIADEYCNPEKGTGAVKITPAHDFNDFIVGKRHDLPSINIFDENACLNDEAPEDLRGLDRFAARKKIVSKLESLGLLDKVESIVHTLPYGERSDVIIEPRLTDQWYVNAKVLAEPAIRAVQDGKTSFIPENWANTYFEWLNNIEPWCISRQLWWGHRIPAWYGPDGAIFAAMNEEEARKQAQKHYGQTVLLNQDEDVLDTWFSSALWPFSTLGWPDQTPELKLCYPTQVLVTGHDIIFFWVARMMMMGLHFTGQVPFEKVYITALVRDEKGQKMSKSKGNVVDPLEFMDKYGADALRFSLAALAGPGRDINFSTSQVEGYRNFATKIWNAFRYCENNQCQWREEFDPQGTVHPINRWIISEVYLLIDDLTKHFESFRFDELCSILYHFVWGKFCDWYLEFTKPLLAGDNETLKSETRATTAWVFGQILHVLHPFMPFITEELWQHLAGDSTGLLINAPWPTYGNVPAKPQVDQAALDDIAWLIHLISEIRAIRNAVNVPAAAKILLQACDVQPQTKTRLGAYQATLIKMARLESLEILPAKNLEAQAGVVQILIGTDLFLLPLQGVVDFEDERQRLNTAIAALDVEIQGSERKLGNQDFIQKAAVEVIEKTKSRRDDAVSRKEKLIQALVRLQAS
jgi:valyl-tRNA synthetase